MTTQRLAMVVLFLGYLQRYLEQLPKICQFLTMLMMSYEKIDS